MSTEKKADDGTVEIHLTVTQKQELLQLNAAQSELVVALGALELQRRTLVTEADKIVAKLQDVQRSFTEKMKAVVAMGGGVVDAQSPASFDFNAGVVKAKKVAAPPADKALN